MMRLHLAQLTALAFAPIGLAACASRNWLAAPEFHYSPIPRERHGKTGAARIKRLAARKRRAKGRK